LGLTGFEGDNEMARVPAVEIEKLKRNVSLRRVVEAKGVTLKQSGQDNFMGKCPFHEDDTASFSVSEKKNLWHCLGACRAGGDVIEFVMRAEGVSFRHACELLREGIQLSPSVGPKHATVPKLPSPVTETGDALNEVRDYYHQQLKQSPEALAYLKSRGLDDKTLINHFKLGFANRTLALRLPEANREAGAKLRGKLQGVGVLRESGHEHLNGSLVIPIEDENGNVVQMYGRKVTESLRKGTAQHLYLAGGHKAAFNSISLAGFDTAIVCEALIDALTFWRHGFKNVISCYGVDGFTPHHFESLKRHGIQHVVLAFDRDEAGDVGAKDLAKRLNEFHCWRVLFPMGMDVNEYALKMAPVEKSLFLALKQATYMGEKLPKESPSFSPLAAESLSVKPARNFPREEAIQDKEMEVTVEAIGDLPAEALQKEATPVQKMETNLNPDESTFQFGPRKYRVRGLQKALPSDSMKLNFLVSMGENCHVDTFDLYSAKARAAFTLATAVECGVDAETIKRDVGQLLQQLEALLEKRRLDAAGPKTPVLTEAQRMEAMKLLRDEGLLQRILEDFARCGVVGEETNKLVGYLAAVSRKLEAPLAVLIQSSSAAGKSSLMEAILAFVPEEEKTKYSAMTGQSLFYMGDTNLQHKVLAIVEEEGASKASYSLKLLQSEGELKIASTGKDPRTGMHKTFEYKVQGPTQLFLTTTAMEIDDELLNRCLVLTVDEDKTQTAAIHNLQRKARMLEGRLMKKEKESILTLHQNAQRMLKPLTVVNNFADCLTFPSDKTRMRRDFPKYLTLIDSIALLHQHQRETKTAKRNGISFEYIEVTPADITMANKLAMAVLGRSMDELPPQTRRLLRQLQNFTAEKAEKEKVLKAEVKFSRREVREALGWNHSQLAIHLNRLFELEYLRLGKDGNAHRYSMNEVFESPKLDGLYDAQNGRTTTSSGFEETSSGPHPGSIFSHEKASKPHLPALRPA
jgi:DNA primase